MLRCGMRSAVEPWSAVLDGPALSTTMRFRYRLFLASEKSCCALHKASRIVSRVKQDMRFIQGEWAQGAFCVFFVSSVLALLQHAAWVPGRRVSNQAKLRNAKAEVRAAQMRSDQPRIAASGCSRMTETSEPGEIQHQRQMPIYLRQRFAPSAPDTDCSLCACYASLRWRWERILPLALGAHSSLCGVG